MGAIPTEITQSKVFKKALKELGPDRAKELLSKDSSELKQAIGQCVSVMDSREADMKDNVEWRKAQDVIKTLKGGLRDTNKPEKVTVDLARAVIQARGE